MTVPMLREQSAFELTQRMANAFAKSDMVPATLKNNPANCLTAMMLAEELGESTMMVLNSIYFVHGRPAFLTKFMIARANRMGVFAGPLRWIDGGDDKNPAETCFGHLTGVQGDARVEITIDLKTAIETGWTTYIDKANKQATHARWATLAMQRQMLRWRTASWLINLYAPNCMLGIPTREELEDISGAEMRYVTPPHPTIDDYKPGATIVYNEIPETDALPPGALGGNVAEALPPSRGPDPAIPPEPPAAVDPPPFRRRRPGPYDPLASGFSSTAAPLVSSPRPRAIGKAAKDNAPPEFTLTAPLDGGLTTEYENLMYYLSTETTRAGLEKFKDNHMRDIEALGPTELAAFWDAYRSRVEAMP